LEGALGASAIIIEPLDVSEIDLMQPSQARRKRLVAARDAALAVTAQPRLRMAGTLVGAAAKHAKPLEVAHNFAGTVRRIVLGRR
jgi:coenzyme F420 hydrogenase subunit beta